MLDRIKREVNKRLFLRAATKLLDTPPISRRDGDVVFFSLLQSSDVLPYLLAIKTVYRAFGMGRIIILNDGSLTERDKETLQRHLIDPEILHINNVDTGTCPTGNCWERLVTIIDLSQNNYVIQVDADLVCKGPIEDAVRQWREKKAFALGNVDCPGVVTFMEMGAWVEKMGWESSNHIQGVTEHRMRELPNSSERKYVRASAAFAGFPSGCFDRDNLKVFSDDFRKLLGNRWDEWGTEQVASNYMIANTESPFLLKPPNYINNTPGRDIWSAELVHFFGTYRYDRGRYKKTLQEALLLL